MKIYISLLLLIIPTISFSSCSKKTESTTSTFAECLDLNEEQAARVQPVTAGLYGERKALRKLRDDVQDEILAQLKSDSVDKDSFELVLKQSWSEVEARHRRRFLSFSEESHSAEDVNGKIADRLDPSVEQGNQMLPVTEELYGERTVFRQARLNVYNEVLAQLKSDTADAPKLESVLRSW